MDEDPEIVYNDLSRAVLHEIMFYKSYFTPSHREDYMDVAFDVWEEYSSMCKEPEKLAGGCRMEELINDSSKMKDLASRTANYIIYDSCLGDYIKERTGWAIPSLQHV